MQAVDHFILEIDDKLPMWVKNTSVTVQKKHSYHMNITAVDECGQKGEELSEIIIIDLGTKTPGFTTPMHMVSTEQELFLGRSDPQMINGAQGKPTALIS